MELDWSRMELGDADLALKVRDFLAEKAGSASVSGINLSDNKLQSIRPLIPLLEHQCCSALKTLSIAGNMLTGDGSGEDGQGASVLLPSLLSLDVSYNSGLSAVPQISAPHLRTLNCQSSGLGGDSLESILARFKELQQLRLQGTAVDDAGVLALIAKAQTDAALQATLRGMGSLELRNSKTQRFRQLSHVMKGLDGTGAERTLAALRAPGAADAQRNGQGELPKDVAAGLPPVRQLPRASGASSRISSRASSRGSEVGGKKNSFEALTEEFKAAAEAASAKEEPKQTFPQTLVERLVGSRHRQFQSVRETC